MPLKDPLLYAAQLVTMTGAPPSDLNALNYSQAVCKIVAMMLADADVDPTTGVPPMVAGPYPVAGKGKIT